MDQIQEVLANDLLEPDPFENAPRNSGPTASDTTMFHQAQLHQESFHADHLTNLALQQPSSIGRKSPASNQRSAFQSEFSLSDQVWRYVISQSFIDQPSLKSKKTNHKHVDPLLLHLYTKEYVSNSDCHFYL